MSKLVKTSKLLSKYECSNSDELKNLSEYVFVTDRVFFNVEYKVGFFIAFKVENQEFPLFLRIQKIIIHNDNAYAICEPWLTTYYDQNYLAYEIEINDLRTHDVVLLNKLKHIVAYEFHQPYNKTAYYIKPLYPIM